MTTTTQDRDFIQEVITDYLLESAIAWIGTNMDPGEVFDEQQLQAWATDSGYVKEEP